METYTTGQFVQKTGLSPKALRIYERMGLIIPGRQENGYRVYTPVNVQEAEIIMLLRTTGLSLKLIEQLFALKRSTLSPEEKLRRCRVLLREMQQELQQKQAAIHLALHNLEQEIAEIETALKQEKLS